MGGRVLSRLATLGRVIDAGTYCLSEVVLPGRGEVVLLHAGPIGAASPNRARRRWDREVQVLVGIDGRAQVWVDGVEVLPDA